MLGVYIHWPYCARICPYCDFNVLRDRGRGGEQLALKDAILADLRRHRELTGPRELTSIFLGGGTPSLMDPDWAGEMITLCQSLWTPGADLEITLEANPTDAEADRFSGFADAGVQRLSLGVQALDDASLTLLGRNHGADEARRAAALGAKLFPRLSLDLIYARPGQTADAWRAELREAVALGAEHLSPYQLTIEAGTAFDRAVKRGTLVPVAEDLAAELFDVTQAVLTDHGFTAYEVSNHARGQAARSRHNLVYWRGRDYVGVGPGAHGRLTLEGARTATFAAARPADYIARVAETGLGWATRETLSARQAAEERLLAGLRIEDGVAFGEIAALDLAPTHPEVLSLIEAGLIAPDPDRLRATPAGRLVLNWVTSRLALA
ncbi:MAG: coproporphyrinogen III oxidase [Phenylobacterium sp.]|uniref:radical SAM family heme chaperone HemW n=1 Tax=Phenylobacterium sp. TaxID=1871053 RepID=UPI001B5D530E|nr:radical SAM family heme chaperone HemW [Phenylobacterium sp.]MBP7648720.1 coproporphyrinogen III oxidase [Phenylobacterium sp.]MBP7817647.1 coproporphyrinogen III oxidase [Phenylobacterium sp.]MBP9231014.1 coproporphyrinogen III oxidase [Phenylobacterium sp.]MBP9754122.1 coproporphyrinogen III oxidase [Phenylobacterium sp.]